MPSLRNTGFAVGATRTLMPLVMPEVATDGLTLTWADSGRNRLASVDGSGRVTALLGWAYHTSRPLAGGLSAACDVVVYAASQSLTLEYGDKPLAATGAKAER